MADLSRYLKKRKIEDRTNEIIQCEKQKEKIMKKIKQNFSDI